ncbi:transporter [Ganoderma sinense ZZ0214-1]|uniref:Potassium transport protein n=1 Tax=Ganoderma sinense ZZ0214-1 TaxID=1077348 RepID=A0A2G8SIY3_9APHY|nr:transporter [Ganoderma sinense ZZ0214-1]
MPSIPSHVHVPGRFRNSKRYVLKHLNFYRIHLLFFTFTPLICSGILYAANTDFHVSYVDCLFNCVSAMTVCGLATVDLSGLTGFQQALLFIQMCMGSPVVVSLVIVYIRRTFFAKKFQRIVEAELKRRAEEQTGVVVEVTEKPWWQRILSHFRLPWKTRLRSYSDAIAQEPGKSRGRYQLRPEMIRRVEEAPKLVDPSGWISEGISEQPSKSPTPTAIKAHMSQMGQKEVDRGGESGTSSQGNTESTEVDKKHDAEQSAGEEIREHEPPELSPAHSATTPQITAGAVPILRTQTNNRQGRSLPLLRTQTVEFAAIPQAIALERRISPIPQEEDITHGTSHRRRSISRPTISRRTMSRPTMSRPTPLRPSGTLPRTGTITTGASHSYVDHPRRTMDRGFGGFPTPFAILSRLFGRAFPKLERKLTRTITIPQSRTIASERGAVPPGSRPVPYISFDAVVGRNSMFQALTQEQLEELGGVEYRALTALLWIVPLYHFGLQLIGFVIIAPYMSLAKWHSDFIPPAQLRVIGTTWFSAYQVVSAYTNTGMSLVDQSMVPFQTAYPMVVTLPFLILAGNTAFPVFLRFQIWIISKLVPRRSRINETLHFLMDHPRRCFVYLFPSHQTWFLLTVVACLTITDWFFFLVLDIGNPEIDSIPFGTRFLLGLLQATAVRSAGFATVTLSALAPAVKVLFVVMMYVSVYPIAMSVRSTNVYEEKSLGVYDDDDAMTETGFNPTGNRAAVWGRYLTMHARRQLSFDMWWLALALFLVCIIEKDGLEDEANSSWFNIFNIIFELVSAYGTVGLSLGLPFASYSFSGALHPLSKLIISLVMLRGRHRGLPVAIDRAVMLPFEFRDDSQDTFEDAYRDEMVDVNLTPQSSDNTSQNHIDGLDTADDRSRMTGSSYTQARAQAHYEDIFDRERSPVRGHDTASRRVSIQADTLRDLESRMNNLADEQARRGGLAS